MSFRNYYRNIPQHYSNEEFDALKNLPHCNLVVLKADNGKFSCLS